MCHMTTYMHTHICVTWLHICIHTYVSHDSFIRSTSSYVTWLKWLFKMWHDSFIRDMTIYTFRQVRGALKKKIIYIHIRVTWLLHTRRSFVRDMTHKTCLYVKGPHMIIYDLLMCQMTLHDYKWFLKWLYLKCETTLFKKKCEMTLFDSTWFFECEMTLFDCLWLCMCEMTLNVSKWLFNDSIWLCMIFNLRNRVKWLYLTVYDFVCVKCL